LAGAKYQRMDALGCSPCGFDKEQAFAWLERAFADHSGFLMFVLEPLLEPLQSDPRWNDLERRVGISN
jgi:hypothetical protein